MRNNDEIITIIKSAMKEQDMSLSELARRVGVAKSAVSRYLNLTRISVKSYRRFCKST